MSTEKKRRESTHTQQQKKENLFVLLKTDKNEYCVLDPYYNTSEKKLTHTREKKGGVILFFSPFSQK